MSKILVVYFSWTGHTREVAEAIAAGLGADLEAIREVNRRSGWLAFLRSAYEVLRGKLVAIVEPQKDPAAYDLVVLGTPVWAGRMSSPLLAYVTRERSRLARIAVFCTEGSASGEQAIRQVGEVCGKDPAVTLIVTAGELASGAWRQKVADFVNALRSA